MAPVFRFALKALACITIAATLISGAAAQPVALPVYQQIDSRGVDVTDATLLLTNLAGVSIGAEGAGALGFSWNYYDGAWRYDWLGTISSSGLIYTVTVGGGTESFTYSGGSWTSNEGSGATLTYDDDCVYIPEFGFKYCTYQEYTYTDRNGVIYVFEKSLANGKMVSADINEGILIEVTKPNGEVITLNHEIVTLGGSPPTEAARLQSISNNLGYQIHFDHASDTATQQSHFPDWRRITKATAFNTDVDTCNVFADTCTFTKDWPEMSYTGSEFKIATATDNRGATAGKTTFTHGHTYNGETYLTGIKLPGSSSNDIAYGYSSGEVTSSTANGVTWNYVYADAAGVRTMTVTKPMSSGVVVKSAISSGLISSVKNGEDEETSYLYDSSGRVTRITAPEGNYTAYTYDSRGNVTQTKLVAKSGSGLSDIVTSASFPASCTNQKTCNKPTSTTDARGKVTDYTYSGTHGGVVTVKFPTAGGARQQVTTNYSAYHSGVQWRPTSITTCTTAQTCAGSANEQKTTINYNGSHLRLANIRKGNGSGAIEAITYFTHNDIGDVSEIDGPLSGTGDKVYLFYDEIRRQIGVIGPDPDGGGALKRRATKTTYNPRGLVSTEEQGTATSTSNLSTFSQLSEVEYTYDAYRRIWRIDHKTSSTTRARTHISYDAAGRVSCQSQRLNLTVNDSACTIGTAHPAYGKNRIVKTNYDEANRVILVVSGQSSGTPKTLVATTYTDNGLEATATDGEGNVTAYEYDGFDRLKKTTFEDSSYEQLAYDAASRVTSKTMRDGSSIAYTYDDRNRITLSDAPGTVNDVNYTYDIAGRMTQAKINAQYTYDIVYDILDRVTSTSNGGWGTLSYQYDIAGRRTRMTWPDSFYVDYVYNTAGDLTEIRENGAASGAGLLAKFTYDDLGRRTSLERAGGSGATTNYAYDTALLLEELEQDLSGTTNDQTLNFTYNPVGQIAARVSANDNYAYDALANVSIPSLFNALNQYVCYGSIAPATCAGGANVTYDDNGNVVAIGSETYSYNALNQLISTGGGATLKYDSMDRLFYASEGGWGAASIFLYDGGDLVLEKDTSGGIIKRWVHGPGVDEPLVEYAGSGTSSKTWLHADERGSVIAGTNSSGALTYINTYDEYGKPASGNVGRFQYTGQVWLEEAGLYYYKARFYNADLGTFMQADPIGYGSGMNMYGYVGGDPINYTDPSGLAFADSCSTSEGVISCTYTNTGGGGGLSSYDQYWLQQQSLLIKGAYLQALYLGGVAAPAASEGNEEAGKNNKKSTCPAGNFSDFNVGVSNIDFKGITGTVRRDGIYDIYGDWTFNIDGTLGTTVQCTFCDGSTGAISGSVDFQNVPVKFPNKEGAGFLAYHPRFWIVQWADRINLAVRHRELIENAITLGADAYLNSPNAICTGASFAKE